jgi:fatty-acid desaturase
VTTTNTAPASTPSTEGKVSGAKPVIADKRPSSEAALVYAFVLVPTLALIAAVPLAWGWGLSWLDVGLAVAFYLASGFGVTVGFHRYFTHRAFKARRALRNGLAIAGSLAMQGDVVTWVADHRRHHAFTDKEGDPHSPWLFGRTPLALARGLFHAHLGWMFNRDRTNADRFAPDLQSDRDIVRIGKLFPLWTLITFLAPAVIGGLATMSWWGALTALFWAGLVRVGQRTSGRWRSSRWASPGTTCTTPTRPALATASAAARSTCPPGSSGRSRSSGGRTPSAGPLPPAEPGSSPAPERVAGHRGPPSSPPGRLAPLGRSSCAATPPTTAARWSAPASAAGRRTGPSRVWGARTRDWVADLR